MSDTESHEEMDSIQAYSEFGSAFDLDPDPLLQFNEKFHSIDVDPIERYVTSALDKQDVRSTTRDGKVRIIYRWRDFMENYDRHPACPSLNHVYAFIQLSIAKNHSTNWIQKQLSYLRNMFDFWIAHPLMPHSGLEESHNPFRVGKKMWASEISKEASDTGLKKPHHRMPLKDLRANLNAIENIFHRSMFTTKFKYGIRPGQAEYMQLGDVRIHDETLNEIYPSLGTHPRINHMQDDVIYFPDLERRPGTKSVLPAIMPIDEELKRLLKSYLLIRPNIDEPWFFINPASGNKLNNTYQNRMWKLYFHPEYAENEFYRSASAHFARHRFTTYWKVEANIKNYDHLKYMRGAKKEQIDPLDDDDVIFTYVHTYYEDVAPLYLSKIYKFGF